MTTLNRSGSASRAEDLIVDQGCHSYTLDPAIRNGDISSRAHNVLQSVAVPRFGGREGSINLTMRGAPTCSAADGRRPMDDNARLTATIDRAGRDLVDYTRCRSAARFPTDMNLCDGHLVVRGEPVELRWHFGPGLRPEIASPQCCRISPAGAHSRPFIEGEGLLES